MFSRKGQLQRSFWKQTIMKVYPLLTGPCDEENGGCHHICIPTSSKETECKCAIGFYLKDDNKNCQSCKSNQNSEFDFTAKSKLSFVSNTQISCTLWNKLSLAVFLFIPSSFMTKFCIQLEFPLFVLFTSETNSCKWVILKVSYCYLVVHLKLVFCDEQILRVL